MPHGHHSVSFKFEKYEQKPKAKNSTERSARWAARKREELLKILSPDGKCSKCGRKPRKHPLEIDHVDGREGWEPRKLNRWSRIARYWKEFHAGIKLRALCKPCNGGHLNRRNHKCPT